MKIGFIGLGNMGWPMAKNLLEKGHEVVGFDLSDSAIKKLEQKGGKSAPDYKSLCEGVDAIVSMLPNGNIVKSVYLSDEGVLACVKGDVLLIDCSTISVKDAQAVQKEAQKKGLSMLDAPVSGGTAGAEAGSLTFIVGGEEKDFNKAKPVLEAMGANIFHAGRGGAGQVAKMCNNMLLAVQMIGSCEALNLGLSHGLDAKVLSDIMKKSSGDNWVLQKYNPEPGVMEGVPASRDYSGGFVVDLMAKDLALASNASNTKNVSTPMGALALNLYKIQSQSGSGHLDFSSIINFLKGPNNEI